MRKHYTFFRYCKCRRFEKIGKFLLKLKRSAKSPHLNCVFLWTLKKELFLCAILKGEVSLYHWPPACLFRNQLYDSWQFLPLFVKQSNPNQSNRGSTVQWCGPLQYSLAQIFVKCNTFLNQSLEALLFLHDIVLFVLWDFGSVLKNSLIRFTQLQKLCKARVF